MISYDSPIISYDFAAEIRRLAEFLRQALIRRVPAVSHGSTACVVWYLAIQHMGLAASAGKHFIHGSNGLQWGEIVGNNLGEFWFSSLFFFVFSVFLGCILFQNG